MSYVDNPFTNPRILSYCPGILGLERGLKRAIGSVRTVAYVEIEAFIVENLLAGMEAGLVDAAPIWCNLKTFPAEQFHGCVDGIIGGYPCQPFSHAGERKGIEDPRHLYPYLEQHVRTIRPVWCFFENVSGHLSLGFAEVRESLSNLGYNVEAGIFTAEEVGAPHLRERLFILAIRKDWLAYAKGSGTGRNTGTIPEQESGSFGQVLRKPVNTGSKFAGLENAAINRFEGSFIESDGPGIINSLPASGTSELADTNGNESGRQPGSISSQSEEIEGEISGEYWQRGGNVVGNEGERGSDLGNPPIIGIQGDGTKREQVLSTQVEPWLSGCASRTDKWPSRPGEHQHKWEASRTESSLGFSIDGYNYREDLLRAAGNSVVEQTAELAFKVLFENHLNHALPLRKIAAG